MFFKDLIHFLITLVLYDLVAHLISRHLVEASQILQT